MNLHPQTVHFPIALLFIAGGLYIYGFIKSDHFFINSGSLLHTFGMIGMILAIVSGKIIQGQVFTVEEAKPLLRNHEILAYGNIWAFSVLWVWQYVRKKYFLKITSRWEKVSFTLIFVLSLGFMGYAAHLGGKMVYKFGVGVEQRGDTTNN